MTVSLGLTGKLCLHVEQPPVINQALSPSDTAWVENFLADFEARGRVVRDGSDLPRLGRAPKIAPLAEAFQSATASGDEATFSGLSARSAGVSVAGHGIFFLGM
jgi:citrate lyase subunit beta/citryl-CoA lyase